MVDNLLNTVERLHFRKMEPRGCHPEYSKSEKRNKISSIKVFLCVLEKWYAVSLLSPQNMVHGKMV